jgi:ABC-type multidrug transport system permease subunit
MPRWEFLASFLFSRLSMLVIEVAVFLGFAGLAFGVPFRGSIWELGLLCVLTSLAFSAMGLLVSSRAKTMEAASGLLNLVMMPMWILSGIFFSATRFPAVIQPLVRALPLTAAIDALRGNMLQGLNLADCAVCGVAADLSLAIERRAFSRSRLLLRRRRRNLRRSRAYCSWHSLQEWHPYILPARALRLRRCG